MEINESKQVQSIVKFDKALYPDQISSIIDEAIIEYNRITMEEWSQKTTLVRWFTSPNLFRSNTAIRNYVSFDGKSPMKLAGPYRLDPERWSEAKYEVRYLISIVGIKNYYLYFNVIPGIAKEYQFGTPIPEKELVSSITIKANMKSSMYWKKQQAKSLDMFVPILKRTIPKMKWGHQIGDLFFFNYCWLVFRIFINYFSIRIMIIYHHGQIFFHIILIHKYEFLQFFWHLNNLLIF